MEAKAIKKVIKTAIANGTEENPVNREAVLIELLTAGVKASTAMSHITKAFKKAGIIAVASVSALGECRAYLKDSMPDMDTYADIVQHAKDMQGKFSINGDDAKGEASAIKLIKAQLKENDLPVPRKVQLGMIAELKLEYYNDDSKEPFSVKALTQYLIDNVDVAEGVMDEAYEKKMAITAGTDFSYSIGLRKGLNLSEMN